MAEFIKTLGLGLEIQDLACQDQVLFSVLTEVSDQDQSWYWSRLIFCFNTCLGLVWKLVSGEVLVLVLNCKKNQDKINTKKDNKKESMKMDFTPKLQEIFLFLICYFQAGILTKDSLPTPV